MTRPHSSFGTVVLIGGCFLAMAGLDYFTGQELVFSCAYLLPISLTAWWFSRRATLSVAGLCGVAAFVVDVLDGAEYSHPGIGYWNAFTCFLIAAVVGIVLSRLKAVLAERERSNEVLSEALEKLKASTEEIRRLQEGLQTVCAWTKRIKVGERWLTPDEFLSTQLHLRLSHGISPEAMAEVFATMPAKSSGAGGEHFAN